MKNYLFQAKDHVSASELEEELKAEGLEHTYLIEEKERTLIGGFSSKKIVTEKAILIEEKHSISWEEQWELFAEDFRDGLAHIDLKPFGAQKSLLLKPGPGFGDLSHPTTYLMLQMMKERMHKQNVVDIGSGSGILSLSALMLGARFARGIDVDPKAIVHSRQNGKLNKLSMQAIFAKTLPKKLASNQIFLMNMILADQKNFDPPQWNAFARHWIVSGILENESKEYLKLTRKWGWISVEEVRRQGWMGWIFRPVK